MTVFCTSKETNDLVKLRYVRILDNRWQMLADISACGKPRLVKPDTPSRSLFNRISGKVHDRMSSSLHLINKGTGGHQTLDELEKKFAVSCTHPRLYRVIIHLCRRSDLI